MGWGDWASPRLWSGGAAGTGAEDGAASSSPVEFVYNRLVGEDDEDGDLHPARAQRVSAPASTSYGGDALVEEDGGAGAGRRVTASASGPLPRLPSLLADGGDTAWDPFVSSSSKGAGSSEGAGGNGGSTEGLTAEQLALGEALAHEAEAGGGGGSGSDSDGGGFAHDRRELLIYAIPITREKVAFLPVVMWKSAPEPEKRPPPVGGVAGMLRARVAAVGDEVSRVWSSLQEAEEGTLRHRIARVGQRLLDSVSAEERLMRGLPSVISSVKIFHPPRLPAEQLMAQMKTLTQKYGLSAVGKAAAATVMLPIAAGIDLIILPGPQILTYYTAWQLYRNTRGAVGVTRFITSTSENVRVDYVPDARLDAAVAALATSRDGVLPDDAIDGLTQALGEPGLEQPLRELRRQRLRKRGCNTGDGAGRYAPLDADADAAGDEEDRPPAATAAS